MHAQFDNHRHGGQIEVARQYLRQKFRKKMLLAGSADAQADSLKRNSKPVVTDFSSNINFLAPPPGLLYRIQRELLCVRTYPPIQPDHLTHLIASHHSCCDEEVLIGNGSMHLIQEIGKWFRHQRLTENGISTLPNPKSMQPPAGNSSSQADIQNHPTLVLCAEPDFSGYKNVANSLSLPLLTIPLSGFSWDLTSMFKVLDQRMRDRRMRDRRLQEDGVRENRVKANKFNNENRIYRQFENHGYHTLVFLSHPHNPIGRLLPWTPAEFLQKSRHYPQVMFAIDESYMDFVLSPSSFITTKSQSFNSSSPSLAIARTIEMPPNIIVIRSLTKFYGIPGLRLGYIRAHHSLVQELKNLLPDWSINHLALQAGCYLFSVKRRKKLQEEAHKWRRMIYHLRGTMYRACHQFGINAVPNSECNFLCIHWQNAYDLFQKLLDEHHLLIRVFSEQPNLFRISIQSARENGRLLQILQSIHSHEHSKHDSISSSRKIHKRKKKVPALMIAGTASDVGKSILVTALGRIFSEDGIRVAPFKSQNMSLESAVTADGLEMATSQAVQAMACRTPPDAKMNPILLKPNHSENPDGQGSHVIVSGRPLGFYSIPAYQHLKKKLFGMVKQQYTALSSGYELILLEGAGSISEVNLKAGDLVNLRMAQFAEAKVLLVGDIERGGIFASFAGSIAMLEHWEREMIYGFFINKFRGNLNLMETAADIIWQSCGRELLGIIPYLSDLALPQEDSLSVDNQIKSWAMGKLPQSAVSNPQFTDNRNANRSFPTSFPASSKKILQIGVIRLPHMAQYSDFLALQSEPDVRLCFVPINRLANVKNLAMLILPGSRNTQADLMELQRHHFQKTLAELIRENSCLIWGICGGYQMLGKGITDSLGVEGESYTQGLQLLDFHTTFTHQKTVMQRTAYHPASRSTLQVYEIHHGQSSVPRNALPIIWSGSEGNSTQKEVGLVYQHHSQAIFGGYVHGIFDNDSFRHFFLNQLRERKGWAALDNRPTFQLEDNLSLLAKKVRPHINMKKIYEILNI